MSKIIFKKFRESLISVLPITILIIVINFAVAPMNIYSLWAFILGAVLLCLGLFLYALGSDTSIEFIGELLGNEIAKSKKIIYMLAISAVIGIIVTVAEPDLTVLAEQVQGINNWVLIAAVAAGVGIFLLIAVLRLILKIDLKWILLAFYGIIFILMFVIPKVFVPLAFDSSGVTTGCVTVPFVMALGGSLSITLGGKDSQDSSFGMVGICSIGPIFAVMLLSLFANLDVQQSLAQGAQYINAGQIFKGYAVALPTYLKEMAVALIPIIIFFLIYNAFSFKLNWKRLMKTFISMIYVFVGLSIFLLGANLGFLPAGQYIGGTLAGTDSRLLIGLGIIIGALLVLAEPAVHVLTKRVEEVTGGVIKKSVMLSVLCCSMAISVCIAMLRIVFDIDIRWVLLAGYGIALALMFVVPKMFTGIAFDSGGVASGPMTAAFLLPMANGAVYAVYGDSPDIATYVMTDAFGAIALVAMTPLVAIQILGLVFRFRTEKARRTEGALFVEMLEDEGKVIDLAEYANEIKGNQTEELSPLKKRIAMRRQKIEKFKSSIKYVGLKKRK